MDSNRSSRTILLAFKGNQLYLSCHAEENRGVGEESHGTEVAWEADTLQTSSHVVQEGAIEKARKPKCWGNKCIK